LRENGNGNANANVMERKRKEVMKNGRLVVSFYEDGDFGNVELGPKLRCISIR